MSNIALAGLMAVSLGTYPAFGDKLASSTGAPYRPLVEAAIDKGPIVELIVRCEKGTAIIAYSKIENLYCGPFGGCVSKPNEAFTKACGR